MDDATLNLRSLKSKKTQLKCAITRFNTYLKSISDAPDTKDLKLRTDKFKSLLNQFEDVQSQIGAFEDIDNPDEHTQFENDYFNLLKLSNEFLDNSLEKPGSLGNEDSHNRVSSHIKLPTINLPHFAGAYEDWFPFYDTFQSLIHNNTDLTDIQRFHYLKSALNGEASAVLHSLEISANNYHEAWQILKTRYDNKRLIVQKHIKAMHELPNATKEGYTTLRHILDDMLRHYRALTALRRPTEHWDDLLVYILTTKFDPITSRDWESTLTSTNMPTFKEITDFLTRKCQTLEVITKPTLSHNAYQNTTPINKIQYNKSTPKTIHYNKASSYVSTNKPTCTFCKGNHLVYQCESLIALSPNMRIQEARAKRLCINCLRDNHLINKCTLISCKTCGKKHHTLLRLSPATTQNSNVQETTTAQVTSNHGTTVHVSTQVLLPTAMIKIQDIKGHTHLCRALLDSGSQSNLITQTLASRLSLPQQKTNISISGISQSTTLATHSLKAKIQSIHSGFRTEIDCLILRKISDRIPLFPICRTRFNIPANIKVADPDFYVPKEIDLLIGAELFYKLLCVGQIGMGSGNPCLQKTLLGWVISGKFPASTAIPTASHCNISTTNQLDHALTRFWELEGYAQQSNLTQDEKYCETHFADTFVRNNEGRFVVALPFKRHPSELGYSRKQALKRFYSIERKLDRDPKLKIEYSTFMQEYLALGHMRKISDAIDLDKPHFYLPHQAVLKEKSATTKLRVVFDGSAKTSTGASLNDILAVGPKLQQDLFEIIVRFRTFKVVLTADIAKMYRQILINQNDTPFQRILWRDNRHEAVKTYELMTVTYGTSAASFLAIRALQELAKEERNTYPKGSEIVLRDFYVDDLLTGAQTIEAAELIRNEIVNILTKGGFELRKWATNKQEILERIANPSDKVILNLDKGEDINMLGLQWDSSEDILQYSVREIISPKRITKRFILSSVAQIFDPLGLISPVIITAKILMQRIWKLKLGWDESVPIDIRSAWLQYGTTLKYINEIRTHRNVVQIDSPKYVELHGFCDASEQGYGACIYLRAVDAAENVSCNLLCSKSRVAPVKTISLPRLELCGALTLAQLMSKIVPVLSVQVERNYYWTDSTIVLNWLNYSSGSWKTFVANRVSEIQQSTNICSWRHVNTKQNPADIITRGATAKVLATSKLLWQGPDWLQEVADHWPSLEQGYEDIEIPEGRRIINSVQLRDEIDWFSRYSSLTRLIRVLTYCQRFKNNILSRIANNSIKTGPLETDELSSTMTRLIKIAQEQNFERDLANLRNQKQLDNKSSLLSLNPFLDEDGIIRVGGRLTHANLPYGQRHQILLCGNHPLTALIITHEHHRHLHAGVQTTLAAIRRKFWPTSARNNIKGIIRRCITCFKANPKGVECQMGNLHPKRITPSRPFENVGVDYFGPIYVREGKRRSSKSVKGYGAVFVCFSTKAIHLELVGNLTTEAFLASLRRFMGRRGKPHNIYSDNGTQFVGANRELMELRQLFQSQQVEDIIHKELSQDNIQWHFIPPRSPHFGGLWEAAVKSVKYHLTRTMGMTSLNYEELSTLLIQIEAILNSRPILSISNDPNDLNFLTPSHFLIGDSVASVAEPNLMHLKTNQLSRWQYIQQVRQHFWKRWSKEYLSQLQSRQRWKTNKGPQLRPGILVIIRDDNTPPLRWSTGRIVETFPGEDGIARVATVKTAKGTFKRASNRLCILPIDS